MINRLCRRGKSAPVAAVDIDNLGQLDRGTTVPVCLCVCVCSTSHISKTGTFLALLLLLLLLAVSASYSPRQHADSPIKTSYVPATHVQFCTRVTFPWVDCFFDLTQWHLTWVLSEIGYTIGFEMAEFLYTPSSTHSFVMACIIHSHYLRHLNVFHHEKVAEVIIFSSRMPNYKAVN